MRRLSRRSQGVECRLNRLLVHCYTSLWQNFLHRGSSRPCLFQEPVRSIFDGFLATPAESPPLCGRAEIIPTNLRAVQVA